MRAGLDAQDEKYWQDLYYGTSDRRVHASDALSASELRNIIDNWDTFSPNMQSILQTRYGIDPSGFIPEDQLGTFKPPDITNLGETNSLILDEEEENIPPPPTPVSPVPQVTTKFDLSKFLSDFESASDAAKQGTLDAPQVETSYPEPLNIEPRLTPVEMLAMKAKSQRLWSIRKLPLEQILEIYLHIYDTQFNITAMKGFTDGLLHKTKQQTQRPQWRTKVQKYRKARTW